MQNDDNRAPLENLPGGAYDEKMESRLGKIETDLATLKIDVAVIRSNYVTKADLYQVKEELYQSNAEFHKALHEMTWKVYGFGTLLVGVVYFLDHYVH